MNLLTQLINNTNVGLVINWKFHQENRWVCAISKFLIDSIVKEFNPVIISSQIEYEIYKRKLKYILSLEPGWSAPKISYDKKLKHKIGIMISDPHNKTGWFQDYFEDNNITYVLSFYKSPFFYHFKTFPREKFIHFPWAVPDEWISKHEIVAHGNEVIIFGGKNSEAYDIRNWCREQRYVTNYNFSGVENKVLKDEKYFSWLTQFDAIIAAGSSNPMYDLVTPKYFEIAAAGALLIGQHCNDLKELGFNQDNSLIFTKSNFLDQINEYRANPCKYIAKRSLGRELIVSRHLISHRLKLIREVFNF